LCREKGTRVLFVFAPSRRNVVPSAAYLAYLQSLGGDLVLMPQEINANPNLWRNAGHLNKEGCRLMTDYFIQQEKARSGWGIPTRVHPPVDTP
jgi:hypothetical protein